MQLPEEFLQRMSASLGEQELGKFLQSYQKPASKGLRLNTLKLQDASLLPQSFALQPILWCESGFYYDAQARPGLHPYHQAGLYYLQDPSAMAVVEALQVSQGDKVLDLCAAPGGKSTQIASKLQNSGLLVANEVITSRAKVLRENLQRMGARCAVVVSNTPQELAKRFSGFFDKVVVDAPCSGEGLFRKNPEAVEQWSLANVNGCAKRQREILAEAAKMLVNGGVLVYSTCTFAPEENAEQIKNFLLEHSDFSALQVDCFPCFGAFSSYQIYPHIHRGEGHFLAILQKEAQVVKHKKSKSGRRLSMKESQDWQVFVRKVLRKELLGDFYQLKDNLYLADFEENLELRGLRTLSVGLHLGKLCKGRFVPSHALALALQGSDVACTLDLGSNDPLLSDYLAGESLRVDLPSGWCLVCVDGFGIGWGKVSGTRLNNYLPKGIRRR